MSNKLSMPSKKRQVDIGADAGVVSPREQQSKVASLILPKSGEKDISVNVTPDLDHYDKQYGMLPRRESAGEVKAREVAELKRLKLIPEDKRTPEESARAVEIMNRYIEDDWEAAQPVPVY